MLNVKGGFGVGIAGKSDMGDIACCVSTSDGDTWSDAVTIFDHNQRHGNLQFAYANSILYKPPGQDVIWCYAMRCPMNSRNSEESQLVGAFSADGGRSWSPVELAMHYTGPLIVVAGIHRLDTPDGPRYLLPAHRNTKRSDPQGTRDQFVLVSTSLLEWKHGGFIPQPATGKVFLHEGNIAPGKAAGELTMVMRTAKYDVEGQALEPPRAFSSVSNDLGRTWSAAKEEPDLHNAKSKAFFGRAANGTHIYVYNDGPAKDRMALRYKLKPKDGTWSEEKTFSDSGTKNSYPTLIEISPGDWRAVWDSGTASKARTNIRFGKLKTPPTELIRRQVWITFEEEKNAATFIPMIGADRVMWACDYPHPDSTFPESRHAIARDMGDLSADDVKLITSDNCRALYGFA